VNPLAYASPPPHTHSCTVIPGMRSGVLVVPDESLLVEGPAKPAAATVAAAAAAVAGGASHDALRGLGTC
jgi:hypothetical protein